MAPPARAIIGETADTVSGGGGRYLRRRFHRHQPQQYTSKRRRCGKEFSPFLTSF